MNPMYLVFSPTYLPTDSGTTAVALLDIVRQAGASPIGFAFLIEKSFEGMCYVCNATYVCLYVCMYVCMYV